MAYFVIWRFLNEVDLSIYCRSVGNNLGGSHEKLSFPQVICVMLIVVGIAGLKLLAKD